jgi:hypothetical protein
MQEPQDRPDTEPCTMFASDRLSRAPSELRIEDLDASFLGKFLDYLQEARGNSTRSADYQPGCHRYYDCRHNMLTIQRRHGSRRASWRRHNSLLFPRGSGKQYAGPVDLP